MLFFCLKKGDKKKHQKFYSLKFITLALVHKSYCFSHASGCVKVKTCSRKIEWLFPSRNDPLSLNCIGRNHCEIFHILLVHLTLAQYFAWKTIHSTYLKFSIQISTHPCVSVCWQSIAKFNREKVQQMKKNSWAVFAQSLIS